VNTPEQPPRLAVGVVGAGRAGTALAAALQRAGHAVVAVHAVSQSSRERADTLLPQARLVPVEAVVAAADLLLLTVPDDVLPAVAAGIAATGAARPGQIVVHASGRYGLGVLDPLAAAGAIPLALHPAMTLTGTSIDLDRLVGCPFAITAPQDVRPIAEALVLQMGGEPVWVPEEARVRYHAALSHAANHLVTLVADALELLADAGVADGQRLLSPLVGAALDNVLRAGDAALTGPVSRGDAGTVAAHLEVLRDSPIRASYLAMARRTADRALASGRLSAERAAALLAILGGQGPAGPAPGPGPGTAPPGEDGPA
jgi:predicted short-subunit dehydrogenase-like oxidoreductase (DUF2520 family)